MVMKAFRRDERDGTQSVGAADKERGYSGPVAEIRHDDAFLYVITDPYEGVAMVNIEALPQMITALRRVKAARAKATAPA